MRMLVLVFALATAIPTLAAESSDDKVLRQLLKKEGFTGKVEESLEKRLGRKIDPAKADLGRLMFFDKGLGLHKSNACAGCHSPTHGWGDTQSIARGIQNNNIVGAALPPAGRDGPRNQRRTPTIANTAFYPVMMWNGRFSSESGNPFDNSKGYKFPPPEGDGLFMPKDPRFFHLLVAQAHIPFTELPEMAGFTGIKESGAVDCSVLLPLNIPFRANIKTGATARKSVLQLKLLDDTPVARPDFCQFDDKQGTPLPLRFPDTDVMNAPIRLQVLNEINRIEQYRTRFAASYPQVKGGNNIDFWMIGQALAEFQIQETYARAPIDKYATGDTTAMTPAAKRGAISFFGKAQCVQCHAVKGKSNEMFSDFKMHNAGVPQIAPVFGKGTGNVAFRDASGNITSAGNLDLGLYEFLNDDEANKFKFRTSPLRNVGLQPAFFHNGAFTRLEDAVRFHLDAANLAKTYDPSTAGVAPDLKKPPAVNTDLVLKTLHPKLSTSPKLSEDEIKDLVTFLAEGLLDSRAGPDSLMQKIPASLPSGATLPTFVKP